MKRIFFQIIILGSLAACNNAVPHVDDPHKIIIEGNHMSQREFLEKYCNNNPNNENCVSVSRAMIRDSTRGKIPANW